MFKINNWNTQKKCEVCSKLTIKTLERLFVLVSVLFVLNINFFFECFFYYLLWKRKCLVGNAIFFKNRTSKSWRTYLPQFLSYTSIFFGKNQCFKEKKCWKQQVYRNLEIISKLIRSYLANFNSLLYLRLILWFSLTKYEFKSNICINKILFYMMNVLKVNQNQNFSVDFVLMFLMLP